MKDLLRHRHFRTQVGKCPKIQDSMSNRISIGIITKRNWVTLWLVKPLFTSSTVACEKYVSTTRISQTWAVIS